MKERDEQGKKKTKRDKERWGSGVLPLILSALSIPGGSCRGC